MATVYRVHKNKNYTAMCNHHLRNKELSLKAKGLLSVMLSLPFDWEYSINGIVSICKESKHTIESCLKELKNERYLDIRKLQEETGVFSYEYHIFEKPYPQPNFPEVENCPQLNTKQSKEVFNKLNTLKDLHTSTNDVQENEKIIITFSAKDGEYKLGKMKFDKYQLTFIFIDVLNELKKAKLWLEDNPRKRKTIRGMPHFITNWLNRADATSKQSNKPKSFEGMSDQL